MLCVKKKPKQLFRQLLNYENEVKGQWKYVRKKFQNVLSRSKMNYEGSLTKTCALILNR